MTIEDKFEHPLKVSLPMLVIEFGKPTETRALQPSNANAPIVPTELGMFMLVKPVHFLKALLPMLVTVDGILNEVKPVQPEKA